MICGLIVLLSFTIYREGYHEGYITRGIIFRQIPRVEGQKMIYYNETNLNTEGKQAKIFQAKQFLVPPLLTASFWFSREIVLPAAAGNTLQLGLEYHVMKGNSMIN